MIIHSKNLFVSAITFQIQVANRYKLNKKLRRLKQKSRQNPADLNLKTQIAQAEVFLLTPQTRRVSWSCLITQIVFLYKYLWNVKCLFEVYKVVA